MSIANKLHDIYVKFSSSMILALSVLLALFFYINLDMQFGFWSIVTIASIASHNHSHILQKSILRLLGSIVGVIISILFIISNSNLLNLLVVFLVLFYSVYNFYTYKNYSYFFRILMVTVTIMFYEVQSNSNIEGYQFLVIRGFEVTLGIFITFIFLILEQIIYFLIFGKKNEIISELKLLLTFDDKNKNSYVSKKVRLEESILIASVSVLTTMASQFYEIPNGYWISLVLIMMVIENLDVNYIKQVKARVIGHIFALILAIGATFLLKYYFYLVYPLTFLVFLCMGLLINYKKEWGSIAITCGAAYSLMTLSSFNASYEIIFWRSLNTFIGMIISIIIMEIIYKKFYKGLN